MKTKKLILVAVTQVVAVFMLNAQALAMMHITTYNDELTTGEWIPPASGLATTTQAATLGVSTCAPLYCAQTGGDCWQAVIDDAYAFSYADTVLLPLVGQTFDGGFIDEAFHDGGRVHEDWHVAYIDALLNVTYGALETWSASYFGNWFHTPAAALAAGNTDLANALTAAVNAFVSDRNTDVTDLAFGHQNTGAEIKPVEGVPTWRGINDNWGQAAVNYANSVTVSFTKGPGDCTCIPEPASLTMAVLGLGTAVSILRRRKALR